MPSDPCGWRSLTGSVFRRHRARSSLRSFLIVIAISVCSPAIAEVIHLRVGQNLARFALLTPSTHRYVRYLIKPNGARQLVDIWSRRLTFEPAPDGGPRAMRIYQRWDRADGSRVLIQDSWFEPATFKPLTHIRRTEQGGKTTVWGFRFTAKGVVGLPGLAGNERAEFRIAQSEEHYNFEQDIEFLQALPLSSGRQFDIPFYDAGIDKQPDRYRFSVAGSARLAGPEGEPINCWMVTADYNTGKVVSRLWLSKKGQVLIREEQYQGDGSILIKALLPPEPRDALALVGPAVPSAEP
jgi:hypothetical protein